jgi:cell cycle sensor histidine kinase DivJ
MVSHELRTPLNAIIGFSQMLTNEECTRLDSAQRRNYARIIDESGAHLLSLVNDILDSSKMETGDYQITPEPFAPAPVISSCCDLLAFKAREVGLELAMRFDDSLPEIVADKRAFKQILINLLSNAVKFTGQGGRVTVGARTDGSIFVVTIADTGIGVCADDLPRLGYPFFQARTASNRRHDGTGLGLSIVKGLITLHGGQLDIASRSGKGTCVTVRLPMNCTHVLAGAKPTNVHHRAFQHVNGITDTKVKKSA